MANSNFEAGAAAASHDGDTIGMRELLAPLQARWYVVAGAMFLAGAIGAGATYLMTPWFTSTTTFLPPQQQQSSAAAALSSLGPLAGLAGSVRSPAEQYIALMQSVTVSDRMIDRFKLMSVYRSKYRSFARDSLAKHAVMLVGKKDGLITVAVEDVDPRRAADMANQYVEELRRMTSVLAVSDAQQRRVFFEKQMLDAKAKLTDAQSALQASGFTSGAIKSVPQAAAEQYAALHAQATAAEVKLQTLRSSLTDSAPAVVQQQTLLDSLRSKLAEYAQSTQAEGSEPGYVGKYREFKYQETLFDLMSKQYELARVDESREGALIQVVDPAQPAELRSSPKRTKIALVAALLVGLLTAVGLMTFGRRPSRQD